MSMLYVFGNVKFFIKLKAPFKEIILTFIYCVLFLYLAFLKDPCLNQDLLFFSIKMNTL